MKITVLQKIICLTDYTTNKRKHRRTWPAKPYANLAHKLLMRRRIILIFTSKVTSLAYFFFWSLMNTKIMSSVYLFDSKHAICLQEAENDFVFQFLNAYDVLLSFVQKNSLQKPHKNQNSRKSLSLFKPVSRYFSLFVYIYL